MEPPKRQRISRNQTRKLQINVSVSDDEFEKIKTYSDQAKLSMSAYLRAKGLRSQIGRKFDNELIGGLVTTLSKCYAAWSKIGNNINQMARRTNARNGEIPPELKDAHEKLEDLFTRTINLQDKIASSLECQNDR